LVIALYAKGSAFNYTTTTLHNVTLVSIEGKTDNFLKGKKSFIVKEEYNK